MFLRLTAALLFIAMPAWANGQAPFCVYSNGPPQCFHYSVQSCQDAARAFNGMCGANPASQQPGGVVRPVSPVPAPRFDPMESMRYIQQRGDEGMRLGMEQREHAARMRLLEAQIEAARQASEPSKTPAPNGWEGVVSAVKAHRARRSIEDWNARQRGDSFRCDDGSGGALYTARPKAGCVYLGEPVR